MMNNFPDNDIQPRLSEDHRESAHVLAARPLAADIPGRGQPNATVLDPHKEIGSIAPVSVSESPQLDRRKTLRDAGHSVAKKIKEKRRVDSSVDVSSFLKRFPSLRISKRSSLGKAPDHEHESKNDPKLESDQEISHSALVSRKDPMSPATSPPSSPNLHQPHIAPINSEDRNEAAMVNSSGGLDQIVENTISGIQRNVSDNAEAFISTHIGASTPQTSIVQVESVSSDFNTRFQNPLDGRDSSYTVPTHPESAHPIRPYRRRASIKEPSPPAAIVQAEPPTNVSPESEETADEDPQVKNMEATPSGAKEKSSFEIAKAVLRKAGRCVSSCPSPLIFLKSRTNPPKLSDSEMTAALDILQGTMDAYVANEVERLIACGIAWCMADEPGNPPSSTTTGSRPTATPNGTDNQSKKRRRGQNRGRRAKDGGVERGGNENDSDDDGDDDDRKRPNKRGKEFDGGTSHARLRCPFYLHDPEKYGQKGCSGEGFPRDVKAQHLKRAHLQPLRCARCQKEMEEQEDLDKHLLEPNRCEMKSKPPDDRISRAQWKKLGSKRGSAANPNTIEDKWTVLYKSLFPHDQNVPSPYEKPALMTPQFVDALKNEFREEITKELGPKIASTMSKIINNMPQIIQRSRIRVNGRVQHFSIEDSGATSQANGIPNRGLRSHSNEHQSSFSNPEDAPSNASNAAPTRPTAPSTPRPSKTRGPLLTRAQVALSPRPRTIVIPDSPAAQKTHRFSAPQWFSGFTSSSENEQTQDSAIAKSTSRPHLPQDLDKPLPQVPQTWSDASGFQLPAFENYDTVHNAPVDLPPSLYLPKKEAYSSTLINGYTTMRAESCPLPN